MASQIVSTTEQAKKIGTALGTGTNTGSMDMGYVRQNFGLYVEYSATPTSPSVQLQGSMDGTNWFNLGSAYTATTSGYVAVTNSPCQFVRATVTVTGATVDLWLAAV